MLRCLSDFGPICHGGVCHRGGMLRSDVDPILARCLVRFWADLWHDFWSYFETIWEALFVSQKPPFFQVVKI